MLIAIPNKILQESAVMIIDREDIPEQGSLNYHLMNGVRLCLKGEKYILARYIMNCPKGMVVDHINGNRLDNRKSNLRICTQFQNTKNRFKSRSNKSGYKGVSFFKAKYPLKKPWVAEIVYNYKRISLGYFYTKEDAAKAYNKKAIELFGEFAKLNVIKE
jgi:hypothetical protein